MRKQHRTLRTSKRKSETKRKQSVTYNWSEKHIDYIRLCENNMYNFAEGAVRAGKTVDNVYAFAHDLKTHPSKIHLASGSTSANAKLNIGDCNGMGLETIFRGQCHWGKYKGNEALIIQGPDTFFQQKIVIFAGGSLSNSFKKIRGNTYGMWIATEINNHHQTFIEEAFNRTLASEKRKYFWDLNPDHPKHPIYTSYIDKYIQKSKTDPNFGGVNYQKFTIFDNINISEEMRKSIIAQYDEGSIWFNRDILGMRCIAEGLIYKKLAAEFSLPDGTKKPHSLTIQEARKLNFEKIVVAIDFGGTGSGHAMVAVGITNDMRFRQKVVALKSRRYLEGAYDEDTGQIIKDVDPNILGNLFADFVESVVQTYGYVTKCYADSAEPVLIRGLKNAMTARGRADLAPHSAFKEAINDRIFTLSVLSASDRFFYVEDECHTLADAIMTCVWDPNKPTENIRLDDGTSDIDTMDAFEYTFERDINKLVQSKQKGGE